MLKKIVLTLSLITPCLSSCVQTIDAETITVSKKYMINVKSILIENFTIEKERNSFDSVYNNGYVTIGADAIKPSFKNLVEKNLKSNLKPSSNSGQLEIAILQSDVLTETRAVDSIAFVGLASALAPRNFKCLVDVRIKHSKSLIRDQYEYIGQLPLSWFDAKIEDRQLFIKKCLDILIEEISQSVVKLTDQ